ncbi:cytochrome c family protein [Aporhodopirellula aestuarii]|uniref:Cytochrome c family protein n=1 Tax=Aporhodopirellula aestuarii TaxID=2950107 RepID=A0ABT0U0N3_9BACT|nr:cytochrome c family protein [Aporhodopirellula aestuarii]MCM2370439.1 cytochrome c family protein [Aporhodopirellula aestuarii]
MRSSLTQVLLIGMVLLAGVFAFVRVTRDSANKTNDPNSTTGKTAHAPATTASATAPATKKDRGSNAPNDTDALTGSSSTTRKVELPEGIVGTATCAGCHPAQFESYQQTDHSRSLAAWTPETSVPLDHFTHSKSRTVYTAFEEAGKLYHREELQISGESDGADPSRMPTGTLPVKYVMGSGAFAHAYLLQDGEYLLQSPMTWYTQPQRYEIAPSYDEEHHSGLTRVVSSRCLYCHAGSLSTPTGNEDVVTIFEEAIGCERCHGPGQSHAQLYQNVDDSDAIAFANITDTLIVHPGNLSRDLADAICAQCHLQGDIVVEQAGKSVWDYRPGEPLDSTIISYKIDDQTQSQKTFVDHFDQIWQSKCYSQSDSLKCISCHDPHHAPSEENIDVVQREYCTQCHQHSECGLSLEERIEQENDRCVACHMPRIKSEVAHAATTHHTIGIHQLDDRKDGTPQGTASVVTDDPMSKVLRRMRSPVEEVSADENASRNDLLARAMQLVKIDIRQPREKGSDSPRPQSPLRDLIAHAKDSPSDLDVLVHIALLARWEAEWLSMHPSETSEQESSQRWQVAGAYAERVIRVEPSPNDNRKKALDVLFDVHYAAQQYADAVAAGRELVASKRSEIHQYNLGLALGKIRRFPEAEHAFKESIRIDGRYLQPYLSLIKLYQAIDPALADRVRRSAAAVQANLESK